jgi:NADH:ubiquinone oxidoreductase subunit 6 (subunit J)
MRLEFVPFAYLLVYVGAIAIMFLFVVVTVDPRLENRPEQLEEVFIPASILSNFLSAFLYFKIMSPISTINQFFDINRIFFLKENIISSLIKVNHQWYNSFAEKKAVAF